MTVSETQTEAFLLLEHKPMVLFEELRETLSHALDPLDMHFRSVPCPSAHRAIFCTDVLHITLELIDRPLSPRVLATALAAPLTRLKEFNYTAAVGRHRHAICVTVKDGAHGVPNDGEAVSDVLKLIALHRTMVILADRTQANLLYWPQSETLLSVRELNETADSAFPASLAIRPEPAQIMLDDGETVQVLQATGAETLIGQPLMIERPPKGVPLSQAIAALAETLNQMVLSSIGPGAVKSVEIEGGSLDLSRRRLDTGAVAFFGSFEGFDAPAPAETAPQPAEDIVSEEDSSAVAEAIAFLAEPEQPQVEPAPEADIVEADAQAEEEAEVQTRKSRRARRVARIEAKRKSLADAAAMAAAEDDLSDHDMIQLELATRRSHAIRSYALCACIAIIMPIPAAAIFLWNVVRGPNLYVTLAGFVAILAFFTASSFLGVRPDAVLTGFARAAAGVGS